MLVTADCPRLTTNQLVPMAQTRSMNDACARADRHHGDDGSNADDDAAQGQRRTNRIDRQRGEGRAGRFSSQAHSGGEVPFVCHAATATEERGTLPASRPLSEAISPSSIRMMRSAAAATFES